MRKKIYTERINKQNHRITSLFTTDFREKVKRVLRCSVTVDICSVLPKPLPIRNNEVWLNDEGKDSVLLNPVLLTFHFKCHNRVFSIREQTSTVKTRMREKKQKMLTLYQKMREDLTDKDNSAAGIIFLRTACNSAFHLKRFSFIHIYSPVWLSYKINITSHPQNKQFHGVKKSRIEDGLQKMYKDKE